MMAAITLLPPLLLALAVAGAFAVSCARAAEPTPAPVDLPRTAVTALGRVTPGRTVISIAAQPGSRILRLDSVEGQLVAVNALLRDQVLVLRRKVRGRISLTTAIPVSWFSYIGGSLQSWTC